MSISNIAYTAMRAVNAPVLYGKSQPENTTVIDEADKKAQKTANKSGLTIALEDFNELMSIQGDESCVGKNKVGRGFFRKFTDWLGFTKQDDNVFKTDNVAKKFGSFYYQDDLYDEAINKHGGLRYAKDGDNINTSALNFVDADIQARNKAYGLRNNSADIMNSDSLGINVLTVGMNYSGYNNIYQNLHVLDLDGNTGEISNREYATYVTTIDGILDGEQDGLLTKEEIEHLNKIDENKLRELLEKNYKDNFEV